MADIVETIIQYGNNDNIEQLVTFLRKTEQVVIYAQIEYLIKQPKFIKYFQYVLCACQVDEEWAYTMKKNITLHSLKLILIDEPPEHYDQIVNLIAEHVDQFAYLPDHLVKMCSILLVGIEKNMIITSCCKLIPKVLHKILYNQKVVYQDEEIPSEQFNEIYIKKILNLPWTCNLLIELIEMFKIMKIPDSVKLEMMEKIVKCLADLDPHTLPHAVTHISELCISDGYVKLFQTLQSIYDDLLYLDNKYENCSKQLVESETNTLGVLNSPLNLMLAEHLEFLSSFAHLPEAVLNPFTISLLMVTAESRRNFSNFNILKKAILCYYVEEEKLESSRFFRDNYVQSFNLTTVMHNLIAYNAKNQRDFILTDVIRLLFKILNTKPSPFIANKLDVICKFAKMNLITIAEKRSPLIRHILKEIFEAITKPNGHYHLIDCLATIGSKFRYPTLQNVNEILNVFEHFEDVMVDQANTCMEVIMRLVRFSGVIKEKVIELLEHQFVCSTPKTRVNVITAYISILKYFTIASHDAFSQHSESIWGTQLSLSSQISLRHSASGNTNKFSNDAVCLEVLNMLACCARKEVDDKVLIYDGLCEVIRYNKELTLSVMYTLWELFQRNVEFDEEVLPPFNFNTILQIQLDQDKVVLREHIGQLLMSFAIVLARFNKYNENSEVAEVTYYTMTMVALAERMAKTDTEHLFKHNNLSDGSTDAMRDQLVLIQSLAVYEAFITYFVLSWTNTSEGIGTLVKSHFIAYRRLAQHALLAQKSKKDSKKKTGLSQVNQSTASNTSNAPKTKKFSLPESILPIEPLQRLVDILYCESVEWSTTDEGNHLKPIVSIHHHVLQAVISLCKRHKQSKKHYYHTMQRLYKYFDLIANTLYDNCILHHSNLIDFDSTTFVLVLDAYYEIKQLQYFWIRDLDAWKEKNQSQDQDIDPQIEKSLATFVSLFDEIDFADDVNYTIVASIMNIIVFFIKCIPIGDDRLAKKMLVWLAKVCRDTEISDKAVGGVIVTCFLNHSIRFTNITDFWRYLALALGNYFGWVSGGENVDVVEMAIVNDHTAFHILEAISNAIKTQLDQIKYLATRLKLEETYHVKTKITVEEVRHVLRKRALNLSTKLRDMATKLYLLNRISLGAVPQAECIMKTNVALFITATTLCKYLLQICTTQDMVFQEVQFDHTITYIMKKLLRVVYERIKFVEEESQDIPKAMKSVDPNSIKKKIRRVTKSVLATLKNIEVLRVNLTKLSKKTKTDVCPNAYLTKMFFVRLRRLNLSSDQDGSDSEDTDFLPNRSNDSSSDSQLSTLSTRAKSKNVETHKSADSSSNESTNEEDGDEPQPSTSRSLKSPRKRIKRSN